MEKTAILFDGRRANQLMTQDDFNYEPFNKRIFDLQFQMADLDLSNDGSHKESSDADEAEKRQENPAAIEEKVKDKSNMI